MEDSFEDYIKFSRNKNAKKGAPPLVTPEIEATAYRKKECDTRAMKIVEFSIEGKLRPEVFARCLPFINQSHYNDIVEERALSKLCGYSICGKRIPEMPKKQYFISTKCNKVYDISDRKNFCCNHCYKASQHIKKQIDDSPLWLRKFEDIPKYNFLPSSEGGLPGECIDLGVSKPAAESSFTSISSFTELSLNDYMENSSDKTEAKSNRTTKQKRGFKKSSRLKQSMQTIKENEIEITDESDIQVRNINNKENDRIIPSVSTKNCIVGLPAIDENVENEEKADEKPPEDQPKSTLPEPKKTRKKKTKTVSNEPLSKSEVENHLKKCINEWLTLDSYIFLHGEQKIKDILNEKKLSDCFESLRVAELQMEQQVKYMNICRRLHLQEMADEKFDKSLLGTTKPKPVPSYTKLKETNKELEVKVRSFFTGGMYEKKDTNLPTQSTEENAKGGSPAVLPLVDVNSQNALRRKIFLNSINKAMQQLLQALQVHSFTSVVSDVQSLVKTFKLKSDNIIFKPMLCNYITVILLHMMTLNDQSLKDILEERRSKDYIDVLLCSFPNKDKFISDILKTLQNIELFVENYVTSN